MDRPKVEVPDTLEKINKQIEALENLIISETKQINDIRYSRDIHREALDTLKAARIEMIDKKASSNNKFIKEKILENGVLKSDLSKQWIIEEIEMILSARNECFKGAQFIGLSSIDEPNQLSVMINAKFGILFVEIFYEIVGDEMLKITKIKDLKSEQEIEW